MGCEALFCQASPGPRGAGVPSVPTHAPSSCYSLHLTPAQHLDLLTSSPLPSSPLFSPLSRREESQPERKSPEVRSFLHPLPHIPNYQAPLQNWSGTRATRSQQSLAVSSLRPRPARYTLKVVTPFNLTNIYGTPAACQALC